MDLSVFTLEQRPELGDEVRRLGSQPWPELMLHDPVADRYWERLFTEFPDFQIFICDTEDKVVATGNTIPFFWNGEPEELPAGWDAVLEQGFIGRERDVRPTTLSALLAIVTPDLRGRGLGGAILTGMKTVAVEHGLNSLIAPVRPTTKSRYPQVPMENYVAWKREDGKPFDPWLRVHAGLGAEMLGIAPRSMVISGNIPDWEKWTRMSFPKSGEYIVPGALQPVVMDLDSDLGTYEEPNVWMQHGVSPVAEP